MPTVILKLPKLNRAVDDWAKMHPEDVVVLGGHEVRKTLEAAKQDIARISDALIKAVHLIEQLNGVVVLEK